MLKLIRVQVISLHKDDKVDSISKFVIGNRFHVTLPIISPELFQIEI